MINIYKYLIFLILILSWTINPFCKKKASINISSYEYLVINFCLNIFIFLFIWLYLFKTNKVNLNVFNKLTKNQWYWSIWGSFLTLLSAFCLIYLIKNYEVTHILPQINPCVITLTFIIGIILFNEKITIKKCLGILSIIIGLIIMNI